MEPRTISASASASATPRIGDGATAWAVPEEHARRLRVRPIHLMAGVNQTSQRRLPCIRGEPLRLPG